MTYCHTFLPGHCFSCFGLDPDTPSEDYEIRLIRAADPAYLPPDSEGLPLYYQAAVESLKAFPAAFEAVLANTSATKFAATAPSRPTASPANTPAPPSPPATR